MKSDGLANETPDNFGKWIAKFQVPLRNYGARFHRRSFRRADTVGQVLYLESESAGIRNPGIGCYFDDPVHDAFGRRGTPRA